MDDPTLLGLVLFVKPEDISSGFYIMDDQWLLVLFGKQDVLFEKVQLKSKGIFVESVKTCFPDGNDFVLL